MTTASPFVGIGPSKFTSSLHHFDAKICQNMPGFAEFIVCWKKKEKSENLEFTRFIRPSTASYWRNSNPRPRHYQGRAEKPARPIFFNILMS